MTPLGWLGSKLSTQTNKILGILLWPNLYAPAIFPYILTTVSWINVILGMLVLCDTRIDIIKKIRTPWLIFHDLVILPYILNVNWCMNIICFDYESVWSDSWPKSKCRSLNYISWKSILNFFSWTKRAIDSNLIWSIEVTCRSKVAKLVLIGNPRWRPSWKSILNFFSWTERPIDSNLSVNLVSDTGPSWPSCFFCFFFCWWVNANSCQHRHSLVKKCK